MRNRIGPGLRKTRSSVNCSNPDVSTHGRFVAEKDTFMKKNAPASGASGILESQSAEPPANGGPNRRPKNRLAAVERVRREETNGHTDTNLNEILRALTALKKGHFTERLPLHWSGVHGKVADVFNDLAELMEH